jgi:acetyl esterase/lipase
MKARVLLLAAVVSCGFSQQARSPLDLANALVPPGAQRITYGSDPLQFGELRLPSGKGPYPVAIVVHGGCWVGKLGTMDERAVALDNMRPAAAALTEAGIATWNVEYRRLGNPGGGWPGTFQDVARAADHIRTLAKTAPLDLKRVIAIGHSAGGHLALWLAARPKLAKTSELYTGDPVQLSGAISLDGPPDLKGALPQEKQICGSPVITDLVGGSPADRSERYHDASPIELMPLGVPQEFFAGRMFAPQVEGYQAAIARTAERNARVTALPTAGHFVFIDPQSEIWPQVIASVKRMLSMPEAR